MLDSDLVALLAIRAECLDGQKRYPRWDAAGSARFHRVDRAIVDELRLRDRPVVVTVGNGERVALRLTRDRLYFVECDAATGEPIHINPGDAGSYGNLLYDYPDCPVAEANGR